MGLFSKKFKPVFTDQEFAQAKETEIAEMLWQEEHLGLRLFTDDQRQAINEGRRTIFVQIDQVVPLAKEFHNENITVGKPSEVLSVANQRSETTERGDWDIQSEVRLRSATALNEPIEAIDLPDAKQVEEDARKFANDVNLMGEKKLRERVRALETQLLLERRSKRLSDIFPLWIFASGALFALGVGQLVNRWKDNQAIRAEVGESAEVAREKQINAILQSNLISGDFYRQTENCYSGLDNLKIWNELLVVQHIKNLPKNKQTCLAMESYANEVERVEKVCRSSVNLVTSDVIDDATVKGIKDTKERTQKYLETFSADHNKFLRENGYAQCQKTKAKK